MTTTHTLPKDYKALVQETYGSQLTVQNIPTPSPSPGSAIVHILAAPILSYAQNVYNGTRGYAYPNPLIPGTGAVVRVVSVGSDATTLGPGNLAVVDGLIRGRDDGDDQFLQGLHEGFSEGSKLLMRQGWPNSGTFAEYAKVPLENCYRLDERRMLASQSEGGLGLSVEKLTFILTLLVPFGGLKSIRLTAGERVVISPATGAFGGAAVMVALAMGARVVAFGRNDDKLKELKSLDDQKIDIVRISDDVIKDTAALKSFGPVDALFDISPPMAANSTHLKSGILALSPSGRVSLMGGLLGDVALPHSFIMHHNITIQGKWMYDREDIAALLKLVDGGMISLSDKQKIKITGKYGLDAWEKAFETAAANPGFGQITLFIP